MGRDETCADWTRFEVDCFGLDLNTVIDPVRANQEEVRPPSKN